MDETVAQSKQPHIFISVKYNYDHIVERSLTAFLNRKGYVSHWHEGTIDILRKGTLPPLLTSGPLTIVAPSLFPNKRQIEPMQASPELIRYLVEQVSNHALVVIVWSQPYSASFWTCLEMQAALLLRKPIVVVRADNEKLPKDFSEFMRNNLCKVTDITREYKTSQVVSLIESLLSTPTRPENHEGIHQKLEEFSRHYRSRYKQPPSGHEDLTHYSRIVSRLRTADENGHLHDEIEKLNSIHLLDDGLRRYLELVIGGQAEAQFEDWYYTYLLGEILDICFLHPTLPLKLREYYEGKIRDALNPPKVTKVEGLINDMVEECLFTREFVEYFGHFLGQTRKSHGALVADSYWELCASRISEAI